jgi:riboflavin kinase/FMN adenylyltransferase
MITVHSPEHAALSLQNGCVVTIGNFDGVHTGHRRLLALTRRRGEERRIPSVVLCFRPHPLHVLAADSAPPLLVGWEQRLRLFAELGLDLCLELPFTPELANLSPEDFVRGTLVPLRVRELLIGHDFSLGKKRAGNAALLSSLGLGYGFSVEQIEPVVTDGVVVSSTLVRDLVRAGRVWEARTLLERFHSVIGPVVRGQARGRELGFPTANLDPPENILPGDGVYAGLLHVDGATWSAVTNIGVKPTFGPCARSVESFLPDAGGIDLYGKTVELSFVQRLRDECRFESVGELRRRIAGDVESARAALTRPEAGFFNAPRHRLSC